MATDSEDPLGLRGTLLAQKYLVGSAVGDGGYSVVYRAEHTIWREPVALKLFTALARVGEEEREQLLAEFIQEGKLLAALSSRSATIVQARDFGTVLTPDGAWIPYMVLEWVDGQPLDQVLDGERQRGLPPRTLHEAMALLEPLATGLHTAHSRGVVHRDVKPENVLVLGDPRGVAPALKLLDFGVAKVMDVQNALLAETGSGPMSFTPRYGAPEQFSRRFGATGPWTDVYALALVMVEVLRGSVLWEEDDCVRLMHIASDPERRPTPAAFGLQVGSAVESVFQRALAIHPAERYRSVGEMWGALHGAVFPGAARWGSSSGAGSSITPLSVEQMEVPALRAPRALPRRRRAAAIALGAVVALAGLAGVVLARAFGAGGAAPAPARGGVAGAGSAALAGLPRGCPAGTTLVPGGRFFMGSDDPSFKLWSPAHRVSVDAFCVDLEEVTVARYTACVERGACARPAERPDYPRGPTTSEPDHQRTRAAQAELCNFGQSGREQHPINCVSWFDAERFCAAQGARLPTEAEWEYAARGSDGRTFPWGDEPGGLGFMNACGSECTSWEASHRLTESARMYEADDGFPGTAPVGSFPRGRTRFGADDVVGNVWEWTADWFQTYRAEEAVNPRGAAAGDRKAIRGGGYNGGVVLWHNPAFRYHQLATATSPAIGFRCVADL